MGKLNTIQKRENLNVVFPIGEKNPGGENHRYVIRVMKDKEILESIDLRFQKGPRNENDSVHGVIDSDLLEIVRHRLQCFQAGPFKSEYNEKALEHLEIALMYLNRRVEDRIERNVLGKYEK